jgi:hypothetical protein
LRIGQAGSAFNCFNGNLDELRISNCTRSADWIKLCYQNQKGDQTLVDLDDYTQWAYSKKIYINTSGMGLNGNVLKFPLLVRIDTTLVGFNQAQGCGQDLRFSKADGTRLNYQIEKWDTAGDAAVAWALVDTVFQSSAAQYIKMYWGKSDAIDRSNDSAVFDTANGFVGVWHLSPETGATDTLRDATPNRFTLTNASSTPATSGTIALGRTYNGSNQRCYVNDANGLDQTGSLTLSAWINHAGLPAAGGSSMGLLSKATAEYRFTDSTLSGGGNYLYMTVGGTRYTSSSATAFAVGTWYYAAASLDAAHDTLLFYKNGAKLGNTVTSATGAPVAGANNLNVGDDQSSNWFNGNLDEVRLEKVYRNPDWINLCYNTQVAAQTVVTPGDVEAYLPLTFTRYGTVNQPDSLDSCTIATNKWTVKFDRNVGGGVKWLSPDSMGTATNQLDSNLFYLVTNNNRSDTGLGTLILLDSNRVSARLLQRKTIGGQQYSITYSVLGNGKVYVKVSTYAASNLSPANGLEFRIAGNSVSNITNTASSATASSCSYFLHSDAGAGRLDPCLTLFENWTQADAITGTASTKYTGIKSSTWKLPAHRSQAWEFMIDIAHANWNDTTGVGLKVADYRSPDSMSFYAGTPLLQKAWESQLAGHWQFEEGSGDTAFDYSGSGNYGVRPAGATWTWTAGKWGGSINLAGSSDKVQIADNAALNGVTGFSVCAWVKPAYAMTASSVIFKKFSTNGYIFSGGAGGVAQLTLNATAFPGRTNIGAGTWYHIGAVYTKCYSVFDTVKIFINGKPDTILTGANYSFDASATAAYIGGGFNGLLDDMRFYGRSLTDEDMKAIYQLGYAADRGMYLLRADNNNTAHFAMDGATTRHYYPAFAIDNYWSTAQPSASVPYVYVNGVRQTFNKDYYAALNDPQNRLIIGFNTAINADATRIYISGNDTLNSTITTTMPKMVWGSTTINSTDYFWVKNFTGNCLGAATAKQFFIDWKMGITASKGGDIWYMLSSKTTPNTVIDTTHGTVSQGLIPGTDAVNASTWGTFAVTMNGAVQVKSSQSTSPFTWSVPESSSVRVILRLGQRNLSDSARLFTQWTIYPTGQIFRWDSIPWVKSTAISRVVSAFGMDNVTSPTMTTSRKYLRGHVSHASLQDFCVALLSFKNSGGTVALPWPKDTMQNSSDGTRTQIEFYDGTTSPNTIWNAVPVQCNLYQDFQKAVMDSAYRDSVCKGVQNCTGASPATRLIAGANGSTSLTSVGDLNNDGFNEREGAYIYNADNANTAHFTLTANGDTCRFYPAFRITNYTATTVPQYVYVNNLPKVKDFGFNAYVKTATHELVMQLNQTLCANADIYISFDRTLAVTMDQFRATGGDAVVKLLWSTESEENNLGFFLYRRINPGFLDSIGRLADTLAVAAADTEDPGAARLMKTATIGYGDSAWRQVNDKIIFGATAGVSYGKRNYSLLDRGVYNDVRYEYKLVAVDYTSARETYDKYAIAMPRRVLPQRYELWTNFPNPFRRLTCLKYDVPVRAKIMLNIYDIRGRLVRQLVRPDKQMKPGFYQVLWDCKDDQGRLLASGPYIYRITAQGFAKARVMVMIR